jgi:hypothetical protein
MEKESMEYRLLDRRPPAVWLQKLLADGGASRQPVPYSEFEKAHPRSTTSCRSAGVGSPVTDGKSPDSGARRPSWRKPGFGCDGDGALPMAELCCAAAGLPTASASCSALARAGPADRRAMGAPIRRRIAEEGQGRVISFLWRVSVGKGDPASARRAERCRRSWAGSARRSMAGEAPCPTPSAAGQPRIDRCHA